MQNRKPHIVIVSTWYPPVMGVAVNRIRAFANYLNKDKYDVTVISLLENDSLAFEEQNGLKVHRVVNNSILRLPSFDKSVSRIHHIFKVLWKLLIIKIQKDEYSSWKNNSVKKLIEINDEHGIDLIISSYPTISAHEAVMLFKKEEPNIKWIADMRDEMSRNPFLSSKQKKQFKKWEGKINSQADAITSVSDPILNDFKKDFKGVKYFEEIRNGFDNDYLENSLIKPSYNETLTFLYAGTFYGSRKPNTFLEALSGLTIQNKMPAKWKFRIIGSSSSFKIPKNIVDNIEFVDKMSQSQCELEMFSADINVFIHPDMGVKGVYSGKLFDYLSVGKPILAITDTDDVAAKLIQHLKAGYIADFDSVEEISKEIITAIEYWNNKTTLDMDIQGIIKLHRKHQVKKLELLIDRLNVETPNN